MFAFRHRTRSIATAEIRTALRKSLALDTPSLLIVNEFSVGDGRLDVLAVGTELVGYEIKSDFDSLSRVSNQLACFSRYCDQLSFVAGPRFAARLLHTLPKWCGVVLAHASDEGVRLVDLRTARRNAAVDVVCQLSLLRKDELDTLALRNTRRTFPTKRKTIEAVAVNASFDDVTTFVTQSLKRRAALPSDSRRA